MSEFKMKPQRVRSTAQDMNTIAKQMKNLEDQILNIQRDLSFEVAQKERIRQRLKTAGNNAASQYKGIYNSASALNNIVNTYETTERRLAGLKTDHFDIIRDTALEHIKDSIAPFPGFGIGNTFGQFLSLIAPGGLIYKLFDGTSPLYTYEKHEEKTKFGTGSWKLDKLDRDHKKTFLSINNDNGELKKSDINVFKLWDKTWKDTKSMFHSEMAAGDKNGTHINAQFDAVKRETSAEVYAGLYYTDPDTGKKKLRAAAGGSLGFTMSALSASAEAQLGDSNFGAYGKINGEAGKLEAKATGAVGLRDAEGNINLTAHGKLSAEAIAGEVSAKAGVKIAGTDVGIKASINAGIGAHAEAGIKDGKISLDIGASLGIGGSVKLEIDVSGTIKTVSGKAQAAWNNFTSWFK